MKVNTDGVLLGAWVELEDAHRILDIGTGTGVIALMAAQRNSRSSIIGVEIDDESYQEALQNVSSSIFSDRVEVVHQSFQEFALSCTQKFEHIVTNPPFFTKGTVSPKTRKSTARHTYYLSFDDLLKGITQLLTTDGKCSLILPIQESELFIELAQQYGLLLTRKTLVYINENTIGRYLMTFSRQEKTYETDTILLRKSDGSYSEAYKSLTADFYLKK